MSFSRVQASVPNFSTIVPDEPAAEHRNSTPAAGSISPDNPTLEEVARARLSEELNAAIESTDPVAGLESAVASVADELIRVPHLAGALKVGYDQGGGIADAVNALVGISLEMDDPVKALEDGAESLAEALAARDIAAQEQRRVTQERWIDEQAACRHARFHRVAELMDVGYALDQAVAITNANEADIRARAAAAGRDPMEAIYRYAMLNGYRGVPPERQRPTTHNRPAGTNVRGGHSSTMEALAQLSDEAFEEATSGERWQRLMQR